MSASPYLVPLFSTCSVDGCDSLVHARGWCRKHYQRWSTHGDVGVVAVKAPVVTVGQRYGRLVVLGELEQRERYGSRAFLCRCDCGVEKRVRSSHLKTGAIRSCGCLLREVNAERMRVQPVTHGQTRGHVLSPEYQSWGAMKQRCLNPNAFGYKRYGGRGIQICERWLDDFEAFRQDMGPRPSDRSLDRIDNDGNYEPGNCRWATAKEQMNNRAV